MLGQIIGESLELDIGDNARIVLLAAISGLSAWFGTRRIRREMGNNGGSTLRDAIDRIERRLDAAGLPPDPGDRRTPGSGPTWGRRADDLPPPAPGPTPASRE